MTQISLKWFDDNGMKANRSKFKFMIMSSEYIEPKELVISDDVCLQSQTVLGVTIDNRLTFNEHIRVCTLKAARQLNAFSLEYPDIWIPNPKVFFITVLLPVISITAPLFGIFVA